MPNCNNSSVFYEFYYLTAHFPKLFKSNDPWNSLRWLACLRDYSSLEQFLITFMISLDNLLSDLKSPLLTFLAFFNLAPKPSYNVIYVAESIPSSNLFSFEFDPKCSRCPLFLESAEPLLLPALQYILRQNFVFNTLLGF